MRIQADFTPSGPVLQRFHDSDARRRFLLGPLGSGKTFTCAFEALKRCKEQEPGPDGVRRTTGLVTRTTLPELKTTALRDWLALMECFGNQLGTCNSSPPITQELRFTLPDQTRVHSDIYFIGLDDPGGVDKVRGMPLTWAWVNEFREIPRGLLTMIYGRCGRFPRMEEGGPTWFGMFGDTNMPDADHWIYKMAEEERPDGWEFFRQPGGLIRDGSRWIENPNAENLEYLPDGYYTGQIAGNKEDWIKVYLAAEYGFVADGKPVYPEYRDSVHCKEFDLNPRLPIYVGIDFGLTPAATFGQKTLTGQWRVHSELVTEDMGAVRFGELLHQAMVERYPGMQFASVSADPAGDSRAQTDERTPMAILRAAGIPAERAPSNDFVQRREAVAKPMMRLIDGEPGYLIHPQCRQLRKAKAGGYCYRRMLVHGGERYRDMPDKESMYSHVADAEQYMMLGAGEGKALIRRQQDTIQRPRMAITD